MNGFNYKINYKGSSKVIKRIVDKLNHITDVMLGTTHDTAFYGDLGNTAYEHSQTTGNAHNMTPDDIGLGNVQRWMEQMNDFICSVYPWGDHDLVEFVDHDGNELLFHSEAQLLGWH